MLQQTQISTGLPYYERWMLRFPTVESLALSTEQDAMSMWQGLGYYRRCRMLCQAAKQISETGFPLSRDEWLKLPGVGRYTAAAIASICFDEPTAVVDGNVERVCARMTCDPAVGSKLKAKTWLWADQIMVVEEPGEWNQAVMELGARVCKPTQPQCSTCPISQFCIAFQTGRTNEFPAPGPKPLVKKYNEHIIIPLCGDEIGVIESHDLSWWKGLSLLPLTSTLDTSQNLIGAEILGEVQYTVTNHKITATVSCHRFATKPVGLIWIKRSNIDKVPLPAPHRKAIQLML